MKRLRSLGGDARGAAVMEFGLLALPLCVVLFGVLDMGFNMYLRSVLNGAINDVSRMAVVQDPNLPGTGTPEARLRAAVHARLSGLVEMDNLELQVASFDEFSRVNAPEKLVTDVNRNGRYDPGDCWIDLDENGEYDTRPNRSGIGGADDIAVYTARIVMPRIVPMAGLIGMSENYDIQVRSAVRNQPYANQAVPPTEC